MTSRLDNSHFIFVFGRFDFFRGGAGIHQPLYHTILDKLHTLPGYTLSIERTSRLERMSDIVPDIDVVAE